MKNKILLNKAIQYNIDIEIQYRNHQNNDVISKRKIFKNILSNISNVNPFKNTILLTTLPF